MRLSTHLLALALVGCTYDWSVPEEAHDPKWGYSEWSHRRPLSIQAMPDDVEDFVAYVNTNDVVWLKSHARPDGMDVRFAAADGVTPLDHELERFADSLSAWVRIPRLIADQETKIYIYFGGNSGAPQQNPAATWKDFDWASHLVLAGDSIADASGQGPVAEATNTVEAFGKVGGAIGVNAGSMVVVKDSSAFAYKSKNATWSLWLSWADQTGTELQHFFGRRGINSADQGWLWKIMAPAGSAPDVVFEYAPAVATRAPVSRLTWTHLAAVKSASQVTMYVNGEEVDSANFASVQDASGANVSLGSSTLGANAWTGVLDEVRIAPVARSAAWLRAEYQNHNAPEAFVAAGPVEVR